MKPEPFPRTLLGGDRLLRFEKSIQLRFCGTRQVMSTSPLNGGYREDLTGVFNFDETPKRGRECTMRAPTYREHMALIAQELGLDPARSAGLSTAAHMDCAALEKGETGGVRVTAIVTAGINRNGGRAGDPAPWDERGSGEECRQPGTVNLLLAVDAHLSEGAMAKAMITATEAKTAAIQELLARSFYSCGLATGTGTDGILVVANPQSPVYLTDAGQHSKLGEQIGRTVLRAIKRALYLETGLGREQQHDVFRRMARFGVTPEALESRFRRNGLPDQEVKRFRGQMREMAREDLLVAHTSLYAHLLDQLNWGMLSGKEVRMAGRTLLAAMGIRPGISVLEGDSWEALAEEYADGLYRLILDRMGQAW